MSVPTVPPKSSRAPIFNVPAVVVGTAALLIAVHGARLLLSDRTDLLILREFAFVPGRIWTVLDPRVIVAHLSAPPADAQALEQAQVARFFIGQGGLKPWTVLTYALLHASVAHLGMNLLWLLAFGAPVARRFGALRFVCLLLVASVAGAAAHTIAHPFDFQPVIGASAAVSGAVAAALRFVFQPGESLGPRGSADEPWHAGAPHMPPLPLASLIRNRQAVSFLIVWLVINLLFGVLAQPLGITDQAIAWEAHVGGFLAGFLLFSLFDPRPAVVG